MTQGIGESAELARFPHTRIVTTQPKAGPESIESYYDEYLAIPGILEEIILSEAETETARAATVDALEIVGRLAIEEDKAEALCLGYAGMSGLDKELEQRLGVPVIDAVAAAVKMAEALVGLKKQTSKALTYKPPEAKVIKGFPQHMQRNR
jgi:Asp/Glu/hydantoin racemase